MEEITIVEDSDNIIGFKERERLNPQDIYRVSALWIKNTEGKILLAKRAYTKKKHPGLWGPAVAGTIAKDETYEQNIIKEAEEELGLLSIKLKKGPKQRVASQDYNHFTQWFFLIIDKDSEDFVIDKKEVAEIRWFTKGELLGLVKNNPSGVINSIKEINLLKSLLG
ncbi:MAG TPA: NUDIX hydrolase [Candidatus Pacearchaeota archaeon]|nr:isopentenyl-diphosphate Delta-isomerase [archaeon BMS3Abin17]HDK42800.1 NUDIX hydrolase [Candidatus Pacearchaeota archaeon]HDZ60995.1 NUDIX hydrolase [Candidatus Pacearchaeota archaeon]